MNKNRNKKKQKKKKRGEIHKKKGDQKIMEKKIKKREGGGEICNQILIEHKEIQFVAFTTPKLLQFSRFTMPIAELENRDVPHNNKTQFAIKTTQFAIKKNNSRSKTWNCDKQKNR